MPELLTNSPRTLGSGHWPGIEFQVKDQDISALTTWSISSDRHTVVVHLQGPIHRLETELEGTGRLLHPPMAGEVWVIPAQARYASLAQGSVVRYAELFVDPDFLSRIAGTPIEFSKVAPRAGHYDEFLYRAVERLAQLIGQPDDISRLAAHTLSQTLYMHVCHEYTSQAPPLTSKPFGPRLLADDERRLRDFIQENLHSSIRLEALASLVHFTEHELLIAFRKSFGTTPAQYVIEQRIGRARWLLRTTQRDITRIALETGFSSHAHLSTVFRNRVGLTPKDFRASQPR